MMKKDEIVLACVKRIDPEFRHEFVSSEGDIVVCACIRDNSDGDVAMYKDEKTGDIYLQNEVEILPTEGKGIVISGYQGIGKSTLSKSRQDTIDLESSHTFINGVRPPNWGQSYVAIACSLAQQGYRVMVSSHAVVQKELIKQYHLGYVNVGFIVPKEGLEHGWVHLLEKRYEQEPTPKNFRALQSCKDGFKEQVQGVKKLAHTHSIPLEGILSPLHLEKAVDKLLCRSLAD